jgi:Cu/Ag efflux pump CusA
MVDRQSPAARRSRTRLVVQVVVSLVLVVAILYFTVKKIDPAQVWAAITDLTWLELTTLGLLAVWNLCTYAFVWMTVIPGLGFWHAMVMTQATTRSPTPYPPGRRSGSA